MSETSTDGSGLEGVDLRVDEGSTAGNGSAPPTPAGGAGGRRSLTERQKKILAVALVVHALVATFTWRDLRRRPAAAVRGPKWLWRVAALLNTSGAMLYWLFGRRGRLAE